ncbi:uracil-DNA glycosylase [Candidatus Parcubacteria bacterium]|nr:uracil-DNA glycosylase [Candidatus Parcubacteria bacterium]
MQVKIGPSWQQYLAEEFEKPYFIELAMFVKKEYANGTVYPLPKNIFRAFDLCPFQKVKVVILGQDPYHGSRQANGLAFAVDEKTMIPPSLQNVFKEITNDLGKPLVHTSGDLSRWAKQGVLLLNATLTVRAQNAGSHQGRGWELFTDAVIQALSEKCEHLVFMLWGNYAKAKGTHINRLKHLVLEAPHPSPFSAASGFFGCRHFSKANDYLVANSKTPIEWL